MASDRWQRLEEIFERASDLVGDDRAAYLDSACGDDAELRRRVEAMLDHDSAPDDPLRQVVREVSQQAVTQRTRTLEGQSIGPYRIERELGRGGMGTVYLARRDDDEYHQQVAIKLVGVGFDTPEMLARFRAERQILASLDHPNIARLLDGGTTGNGQPYLVMEHVAGRPLHTYCDAERLPMRRRLELFRQVCAAVQYAHRNLVVHRDLKPSNVLVTDEGVPKLLDFGIAKLLDDDVPETQARTRTEMRLLTPEYASPEQVRGESITTASDVYSLGIILYELLTGCRPYEIGTLSPSEVERVVCQQIPTRPSTAVGKRAETGGGTTGPDIETIARARRIAPERLRRRLSGDLDNVVLMALRKETSRRYDSVEQLSDDIRRHLEGLPVSARKDTWSYRTAKFIGRNRTIVAAASVVALLLAGLAATMTVQAGRVTRQRDRARAAEQTARTEAETSRRATEFLVDLFQVADPSQARGREITAEEILERGAAKLDTELADEPQVRATLMATVGDVYTNLGLYDRAAPMLEKALALRRELHDELHGDVAETWNQLANLRYELGDFGGSEEAIRNALEIQRQVFPDGDVSLSLTLNNLGWLAYEAGRLEEAERLHGEALAMRRSLLGEENEAVAESLNNLAAALDEQGRSEEGVVLMQQSLDMRRRLLGDNHPDVAVGLANLAIFLRNLGRLEEAESLHREALALQIAVYGEDHTTVATTLSVLGRYLSREGKEEEAESMLRRALAIDRASRGDSNSFVAYDMAGLAEVLRRQNKMDEAEDLLRQAIAIYREAPHTSGHLAPALVDLGDLLRHTGRSVAAEVLLQEGVAMLAELVAPDNQTLARARISLGACLRDLDRLEEAEPLLLAGHERFRQLEAKESIARWAADELVRLYEGWGQPEKADLYRASEEEAAD